MTPRELRALLFQIDNKNLTVEELRNKLFDLTNQDNDITYDEINIINGKQHEESVTIQESTREPLRHLDIINKYPPTKKPRTNKKSIKTRIGDNVKFKSGKLGDNELYTGIIEKKEQDGYRGCLMYTIAESNGNKHYVSNSEILEVIK